MTMIIIIIYIDIYPGGPWGFREPGDLDFRRHNNIHRHNPGGHNNIHIHRFTCS